ncbi:MAG: hypothetical protein ACR2QU_11650 [Gammaproteobacteria bacterium]
MFRLIVVAAAMVVGVLCIGTSQAQEEQVVVVERTDIKRIAGEVVNVRGNLMTLRHNDGSGRSSYRIPRGASISVAGSQMRLQDLQPGQNIRVYYRETSTGRVIVISPPQETENAVVIEEVEEVAPIAAEDEAPETIVMPTTASILPLTGLLGGLFFGVGLFTRVLRQHRA